eukprot:GHUV01015652.1.p1 GENE.GHUV01015652.1~~GHUV01015652.1.p1  ORF type:complete len:162 (-),score=20.85 GHUV01015652.1:666-1151(-)
MTSKVSSRTHSVLCAHTGPQMDTHRVKDEHTIRKSKSLLWTDSTPDQSTNNIMKSRSYMQDLTTWLQVKKVSSDPNFSRPRSCALLLLCLLPLLPQVSIASGSGCNSIVLTCVQYSRICDAPMLQHTSISVCGSGQSAPAAACAPQSEHQPQQPQQSSVAE